MNIGTWGPSAAKRLAVANRAGMMWLENENLHPDYLKIFLQEPTINFLKRTRHTFTFSHKWEARCGLPTAWRHHQWHCSFRVSNAKSIHLACSVLQITESVKRLLQLGKDFADKSMDGRQQWVTTHRKREVAILVHARYLPSSSSLIEWLTWNTM